MYSLEDVIEFGKHKNKTVKQAIDIDYSWVRWANDEVDYFDLDETASAYLDQTIEVMEEDENRIGYGDWGDWSDMF